MATRLQNKHRAPRLAFSAPQGPGHRATLVWPGARAAMAKLERTGSALRTADFKRYGTYQMENLLNQLTFCKIFRCLSNIDRIRLKIDIRLVTVNVCQACGRIRAKFHIMLAFTYLWSIYVFFQFICPLGFNANQIRLKGCLGGFLVYFRTKIWLPMGLHVVT